jgi:hypothetical protein
MIGAVAIQDDPAGCAMVQQAQPLIANYHAGQPRSTNVLRVVYFIPKDGEPLPNYAERLDRVMNDVSVFYRDGLKRLGVETAGLPLERQDGKLVLHLVRGKLSASQYNYESGDETAKEISLALKPIMDVEREHVLVFYALCKKEKDGRYVFSTPYYGGGSQRAGLCHAADCELLDPLLLTETNRTMVFSEHYYKRMEMTVARFNSWYLGGVAHELGHALGLPHDDGGVTEKQFGISLMGEGNLTYRQELWGGGPPTYLGRASVLQLASLGLLIGKDHGRWDRVKSKFQSLNFIATNDTLLIQGVITSAVPAYAVIAYAWPSERDDDHFAQTFPCLVNDGAFTLVLKDLCPGNWHLKLCRLHVNGGTATEEFSLGYDDAHVPNVAEMKSAWTVDGKQIALAKGTDVNALKDEWIAAKAESMVMRHRSDARKFLKDATLAAAPESEAARKFQVLRSVLDPVAPVDLAAVSDDSVFLSDANWTDAKVGWGKVARNYFWFDNRIQNGIFLTLGGQFFDKGLYAHSPARFVFPLAGKWKKFTATIGLRDGADIEGSAIFTVRADGNKIYRSRILRVGERTEVNVDISQVKELELLTEGGEGHNHNSWAIWAEPKVQR